jgi:hypothetical protein
MDQCRNEEISHLIAPHLFLVSTRKREHVKVGDGQKIDMEKLYIPIDLTLVVK